MNPVRVLPLAVIFVLGSCYPESDLQPESVVTPSDCGARERIDAQVKNQALLDFASVGKRCEPFAIQTFVQNSQETVFSLRLLSGQVRRPQSLRPRRLQQKLAQAEVASLCSSS